MDSTVDALATVSQVDGMKFLFHRWESDRIQHVYHKTFDLIQQQLGLATPEVLRLLKFKAVRHETSDRGSLYSLTLYHEAAALYYLLPFEWANHLQEMHFKAYFVEAEPGIYQMIPDAVYAANYSLNISIFKSRIREKHKKGTGEKGVRIGSRKSDKHGVIYRRAQERPGFETRTSDELVRRSVREVRRDRDAIRATVKLSDAECWYLLHRKLAVAGYAAAMKTLRAMGVNLADYISGVTNAALEDQQGDVMPLDRNWEGYLLGAEQE